MRVHTLDSIRHLAEFIDITYPYASKSTIMYKGTIWEGFKDNSNLCFFTDCYKENLREMFPNYNFQRSGNEYYNSAYDIRHDIKYLSERILWALKLDIDDWNIFHDELITRLIRFCPTHYENCINHFHNAAQFFKNHGL